MELLAGRKKAFTFGKFLPMHKGHEFLFKYAQTFSDLTVIVLIEESEPYQGRDQFIAAAIANQCSPLIKVITYRYSEKDLSRSSVPDREVSRKWSEVFKTLVPDAQEVYTSELYGDYVAEYMDIEHICVDPDRITLPISATEINTDIIKNWKFISPELRHYYQKTVVVLGTESSGKTSLCEALWGDLPCDFVHETGRFLSQDKTITSYLLHEIKGKHLGNIINACTYKNPILLLDTDCNTTDSYHRFYYAGMPLSISDSCRIFSKAHLYLYCEPDIPFVQDGTRMSKEEALRLDGILRGILVEQNISPVFLSGSFEERETKARSAIFNLFKQKQTT